MRFTRKFEEGFVHGYVLGVGPEFVLVALVDDGVRYGGFGCFRLKDVRDLKLDPYSHFSEAALKQLGEKFPRRLSIDLSNISTILSSANRLFPLITIHRATKDPDVCWIGKVVEITSGRVSL
jgi:hypothetical protein